MFFINVDTSEIEDLLNIGDAFKKVSADAARNLAAMTMGKVQELASQKLKTRRELYISALSLFQQDGCWVINLEARAMFIEEGMPPHSMVDDMLKSKKTKRAKDGSLYLVVPFDHGPNKGAAQTTQAQQDLVSTLKSEFKKRKLPWGKLETGDDGKPKLGKIRGFDIKNSPIKTQEGPGQGKGPIGGVRQGPTGTPFLQGVTVYQNIVKDKFGKEKVKKSVVTFRIVSSKHKSEGRWFHPGLEPVKLLDVAETWARETWEREIVPSLVDEILSKL